MFDKPYTNNLRTYRTNAGLRQQDVALHLGLDCADRISHWEKGSAVPHLVNLFRLAVLYKTTPQALYPNLYQEIENATLNPSPVI